jgi:hypothetical protein
MNGEALSPRFGSAAKESAGLSAASIQTVREKQARVAGQAQSHYEKHRESWIAKRYNQLLKQDAPALALRPAGMPEDRSARLMRAAVHLTDRKQAARLQKIGAAADRMAGRSNSPIER